MKLSTRLMNRVFVSTELALIKYISADKNEEGFEKVNESKVSIFEKRNETDFLLDFLKKVKERNLV